MKLQRKKEKSIKNKHTKEFEIQQIVFLWVYRELGGERERRELSFEAAQVIAVVVPHVSLFDL